MDPASEIRSLVVTASKEMIKELQFLYEVKEQVEEMKIELQWMQSFLEDADYHTSTAQSQQQQRKSRVFRQWVLQIKEASLDAEDIVDTYLAKLALRKRGGVINVINRYACFIKHSIDIHIVGSEIEAFKLKLSNLRLRLQTYGGRELVRVTDAGASSSTYTSSLQTRSYGHIHDRNIVGLEENINEVVGLVLKEEEWCRVVSIYGTGGLGKTTLAKKVYLDERVRRRFDKFAWVCVSQQFRQRDVWESVLLELTCPSTEERKEISKLKDGELVARLCQVQICQKCVVVLDDVWHITDWENLHAGFPVEEIGGSKIVFTTRNDEVARHASQRSSYGGLKPLSDELGLELLRKIALEGRDEIADVKSMEDLGSKMLKHCGGSPLAITVMGGILATKDSLREWQTVHDNVNAYLRRGKGCNEDEGLGVHHVLAYSYYDLPPQLKTCFLSFSLFPEDHEIPTKTLMRMWMVEGSVSVEYDGEGEETMEDVAERYLIELVGRGMIEAGKKGCTGRIRTCRIHDVMRDMCLSKAIQENFTHRDGMRNANAVPKGKIRRLLWAGKGDEIEEVLTIFEGYKRKVHSQVRSLILYKPPAVASWMYNNNTLISVRLADNFKLLKILVLENIIFSENKVLQKEIEKLIHLRCLSLRGSLLCDAIPSLDLFGCMETLDLRVNTYKAARSRRVVQIWKMKHLRHVYFPCWILRQSSEGANVITEINPNLQTLVNFDDETGKVDRILMFPNLKKLGVFIRDVKGLNELFRNNKGFGSRLFSVDISSVFYDNGDIDLEAVLASCPHLYKLKVDGRIEKLPQLNRFPTKLTKLKLRKTEIQDSEHMETVLGNLPNLSILFLVEESYKGEQLCFKKGTFLQLKSLKLMDLPNLTDWMVEQGAMPMLENLDISGVRTLGIVPEGLRFIPTLKEIQILNMSHEFEERLKEGGADFHKVKHVPSITFLEYDMSRDREYTV